MRQPRGFWGFLPTFPLFSLKTFTKKCILYREFKQIKVGFWAKHKNQSKRGDNFMKVERLGSMVPGVRIPIMINGKQVKHYQCRVDDSGRTFMEINNKKLYEHNFPMGEEITI